MLKAVLFDFNGVIINDEPLHDKLLEKILLEENLRAKPGEFWEICLGRSDRACLVELLNRRGRVVTEEQLNTLMARKSLYYQAELEKIEKLPTYPGLEDFIYQIRSAHLPMAVVSGAMRAEIEMVLNRLHLAEHFSVIVAGDDITTSKPEPDGYLLAVERLNETFPNLKLQPANCLVIEDTFPGIEAAKRAGMQVVGLATTYPFHMMQRQSNWAVDYFTDLELDRIKRVFAGDTKAPAVA
ncbi:MULTISPECIES: HAD family phosphatase [unclassified Leptolyngbya]|uniref:HAD family hydrolase n=1 Tax=unclassified Leptolyngbya TaxID=2650499 RepID=UPI001683F952|nr:MULTISPECIES: HAD family phosphatase [unclassified Leptolyngbya]MBD1912396.1 HAD family phosphatase [Leptolyngbya sp. FACHB-8]MBD2154800.1 HAD family phosphatase [Leptolyngbya sp. FACHB-16]